MLIGVALLIEQDKHRALSHLSRRDVEQLRGRSDARGQKGVRGWHPGVSGREAFGEE